MELFLRRGVVLIVEIIIIGALIYSHTYSNVTDCSYESFNYEDVPRGDGDRDGTKGYGYYYGGFREDDYSSLN